jgi:hypothetical protein
MAFPAAIVLVAGSTLTLGAGITPAALSVQTREINVGELVYDWGLQQNTLPSGVKVADGTAPCDTVTGTTNNGRDTVPDCRFD